MVLGGLTCTVLLGRHALRTWPTGISGRIVWVAPIALGLYVLVALPYLKALTPMVGATLALGRACMVALVRDLRATADKALANPV